MLRHLTESIIHLAGRHALLAYFLTFLLTAAEAFPVIGAFVPGTAIVIALGALVPAGALRFWPLIGWATGGAILGDGLPFCVGYRYRERSSRLWPLARYPRLLPEGQVFFERHGGSAVIIARFTPGVRAMVPIVAGISGMSPVRFYILDIVSAILWAPTHVIFGVLIGASLTILGAVAGRLEAVLTGVLIGLALVLWLAPKLIRLVIGWLEALREPILIWSKARDSWVRRPVASLLDPDRTELSGLLVLAAVLTGSLWLFLGVLQDLIAGDPLVYTDRAILHFFEPYRTGLAVQIAIVISRLGSGPVSLVVAGVTLIWLDRRRAWRAAAYGIAAVIGASLFTAGLDLALHRPPPSPLRPEWNLIPFPGGDLATASALYGFLTVIVGRNLGGRERIAILTMTALFTALQLASRVYLGMDWLSSDLAAAAFGFAWAAGLGLAYVVRPIEPVPPWHLVAITAATLAVVGTPAVALEHRADVARYDAHYTGSTMTCDSWLQRGWKNLPARSLSMLGRFAQPLTIQWVGSVNELTAALVRKGWHAPPPWTFRNALAFFAPHSSPSDIPALPRWNDGRRANLVLFFTGQGIPSDQRLVLRLWKTSVAITTPDGRVLPLRVGEIEKQRLKRLFAILTIPIRRNSVQPMLPEIAGLLPASRLVTRPSSGNPVLLAGPRDIESQGCFSPTPTKGGT